MRASPPAETSPAKSVKSRLALMLKLPALAMPAVPVSTSWRVPLRSNSASRVAGEVGDIATGAQAQIAAFDLSGEITDVKPGV